MDILRWSRLLAVLLTLSLSATACGTDDDDDPAHTSDVSGGSEEDSDDDATQDDDVEEDVEAEDVGYDEVEEDTDEGVEEDTDEGVEEDTDEGVEEDTDEDVDEDTDEDVDEDTDEDIYDEDIYDEDIYDVEDDADVDDEDAWGRLRIFNGVYDLELVDIWLDDQLVFSSIGFAESSGPWLDVAEGEIELRVTHPGAEPSDEPLYEGIVFVEEDIDHIVYGYGSYAERERGEIAFGFVQADYDQTQSTSDTEIYVSNTIINRHIEMVEVSYDVPETWDPNVGGLFWWLSPGDTQRSELFGFGELYIGAALYSEFYERYYRVPFTTSGEIVHFFFITDFGPDGSSDLDYKLVVLLDSGAVVPIPELEITMPDGYWRFFNAYLAAEELALWIDGELVRPNIGTTDFSGAYQPIEGGWHEFVLTFADETDPENYIAWDWAFVEPGSYVTIYTYDSLVDPGRPPGFDYVEVGLKVAPSWDSDDLEDELSLMLVHASKRAWRTKLYQSDMEISFPADEADLVTDFFDISWFEYLSADSSSEVYLGIEPSQSYFSLAYLISPSQVEGFVELFLVDNPHEGINDHEAVSVYALYQDGSMEVFETITEQNVGGVWRMFHGMSGVGPVTIWLDGEVAIEGLEFGEVSGYFEHVEEGAHTLEVSAFDDPSMIYSGLSASFEISNGEAVTHYLYGTYDSDTSGDQPAGLGSFEHEVSDFFGLTAVHSINASASLGGVTIEWEGDQQQLTELPGLNERGVLNRVLDTYYRFGLLADLRPSEEWMYYSRYYHYTGSYIQFIVDDEFGVGERPRIIEVDIYSRYSEELNISEEFSFRVFNAMECDEPIQLWIDGQPFGDPVSQGELVVFDADSFYHNMWTSYREYELAASRAGEPHSEAFAGSDFSLQDDNLTVLIGGDCEDDSGWLEYANVQALEPLDSETYPDHVSLGFINLVSNLRNWVHVGTDEWGRSYNNYWYGGEISVPPTTRAVHEATVSIHYYDDYVFDLDLSEQYSPLTVIIGGEYVEGEVDTIRIYGLSEDNEVTEFDYEHVD